LPDNSLGDFSLATFRLNEELSYEVADGYRVLSTSVDIDKIFEQGNISLGTKQNKNYSMLVIYLPTQELKDQFIDIWTNDPYYKNTFNFEVEDIIFIDKPVTIYPDYEGDDLYQAIFYIPKSCK